MNVGKRVEIVDSLPERPSRPTDGHKGTFGRVLIVAGSRGMSGAAGLAGLGALRGGAGMVTLAVPEKIQSIVAMAEPSWLTVALPDTTDGELSKSAALVLDSVVTHQTAIGIGPGLGQSPDVNEIVHRIYETPKPLVVDADALNVFAAAGGVPDAPKNATRVLTPHPGEFARLTNRTIDDVIQHRQELAVEFAYRRGVVVVLKGPGTVITDGKRLAVNATGNSGMATGGSGDVLTGLLTALLAQGMTGFDAAQLGVHLHGLAGDLAARDLSEPGLIASDLPKYIVMAWNSLD